MQLKVHADIYECSIFYVLFGHCLLNICIHWFWRLINKEEWEICGINIGVNSGRDPCSSAINRIHISWYSNKKHDKLSNKLMNNSYDSPIIFSIYFSKRLYAIMTVLNNECIYILWLWIISVCVNTGEFLHWWFSIRINISVDEILKEEFRVLEVTFFVVIGISVDFSHGIFKILFPENCFCEIRRVD